MLQIRPEGNTRSASLSFGSAWCDALKSERLAPRRRRIRRLRVTTRPDATRKSNWPLYRLVKLGLLKLLEWEMRLQKVAAGKRFAINAHIRRTKGA